MIFHGYKSRLLKIRICRKYNYTGPQYFYPEHKITYGNTAYRHSRDRKHLKFKFIVYLCFFYSLFFSFFVFFLILRTSKSLSAKCKHLFLFVKTPSTRYERRDMRSFYPQNANINCYITSLYPQHANIHFYVKTTINPLCR